MFLNVRLVFCVVLNFFVSHCSAEKEDQGLLDLFVYEGLLHVKASDFDFRSVNDILFWTDNKFNADKYTPFDIQDNLGQRIYLTGQITNLDRYDSHNVDSVIAVLREGIPEQINSFTDLIYRGAGDASMGTFCFLQKKMVGNLKNFNVTQRETIFIKDRKRTYVKISGSAVFEKAHGLLILYFRLSDANQLWLAKIDFIPVNNQENTFLKVLSKEDVSNLRGKNFKTLEQNFSPYFTKQISGQRRRFEKDLAQYDISDTMYSFRLFSRWGQITLRCIFFTRGSNDKLDISYTPINKKFMIDMINREQYNKL